MNQLYILDPITDDKLTAEGEKTQQTLRSPLVEKRLFLNGEVIHWEFDNFTSFYSSMAGKKIENKLSTIDEWVERISNISGINKKVVKEALEVYSMIPAHNSKN